MSCTVTFSVAYWVLKSKSTGGYQLNKFGVVTSSTRRHALVHHTRTEALQSKYGTVNPDDWTLVRVTVPIKGKF